MNNDMTDVSSHYTSHGSKEANKYGKNTLTSSLFLPKATHQSFQAHDNNNDLFGDVTPLESPVDSLHGSFSQIPGTCQPSPFHSVCQSTGSLKGSASVSSKSPSKNRSYDTPYTSPSMDSVPCTPITLGKNVVSPTSIPMVPSTSVLSTLQSVTPETLQRPVKKLTISMSHHEATILDALMGLRDHDHDGGNRSSQSQVKYHLQKPFASVSSDMNMEISIGTSESSVGSSLNLEAENSKYNNKNYSNIGPSRRQQESNAFMDSIAKNLCDLSWKGCPSRCRYQCWCLLCKYMTPQQLQLTTQTCPVAQSGDSNSGASQRQQASDRHKASALFNTLNHFEHPQRLRKVQEYHSLIRRCYDNIPWTLLCGNSNRHYHLDPNSSDLDGTASLNLGNVSPTVADSMLRGYCPEGTRHSDITSRALQSTSVNGLVETQDYDNGQRVYNCGIPFIYEGLSVLFGSKWDPPKGHTCECVTDSSKIGVFAQDNSGQTSKENSCCCNSSNSFFDPGVSTNSNAAMGVTESHLSLDPHLLHVPKWVFLIQSAINEAMLLSALSNMQQGQYTCNPSSLIHSHWTLAVTSGGSISDTAAATSPAISMLFSTIEIPPSPQQSTEDYLLSWKVAKTARVHTVITKHKEANQCSRHNIEGLHFEPSECGDEARRRAKALLSPEEISTMQQIRKDVPRTTSFGANICHFTDFPAMTAAKRKQQLRHSNTYHTDTFVCDNGGDNLIQSVNTLSPSMLQQLTGQSRSCVLLKHPYVMSLMERVLYLWALRHPASGYVQGMNDLVLPFLLTVFAEALCFSGTTLKNQQEIYSFHKNEKNKEKNVSVNYNHEGNMYPEVKSGNQNACKHSDVQGKHQTNQSNTIYSLLYNHLPEVTSNGDIELQWLLDIPNMYDLNELMVKRGLLHSILVEDVESSISADDQVPDSCSSESMYISPSSRINNADKRSYCYVLTPTPLWVAVEADVFFLFSKLMDSLQENYTEVAMKDEQFGRAVADAVTVGRKGSSIRTGDSNQFGCRVSDESIPAGTTAGAMFTLVHKLEHVVRNADPLLHSFIADFLSIPFSYFGFKWMTCMGLRELPTMVGLRIWDTYIAENDSASRPDLGSDEEAVIKRSWCVGIVSSGNEVEKQRENAKGKTLFTSCLTFHVYFSAALLINIYGGHLAKMYAERIIKAARSRKKIRLEKEFNTLTADKKKLSLPKRIVKQLEIEKWNMDNRDDLCSAEWNESALASDCYLDSTLCHRRFLFYLNSPAVSLESSDMRASNDNFTLSRRESDDVQPQRIPSSHSILSAVNSQGGITRTRSRSPNPRGFGVFCEEVFGSKTTSVNPKVENKTLVNQDDPIILNENTLAVDEDDCYGLEEDGFFDKMAFIGDAMKVLQGPAPFHFLFEENGNTHMGGCRHSESNTDTASLERSTGELLSQAFLLQQLFEGSEPYLMARDKTNSLLPSTFGRVRSGGSDSSTTSLGANQGSDSFLSSVLKRISTNKESPQEGGTQNQTASDMRDHMNISGKIHFFGIPISSSSGIYNQILNSSVGGSPVSGTEACVSKGHSSSASCGPSLSSIKSSFSASLTAAMQPYSTRACDGRFSSSSTYTRGSSSSNRLIFNGSILGSVLPKSNPSVAHNETGTCVASSPLATPSAVKRSNVSKKWWPSLFSKKEKK